MVHRAATIPDAELSHSAWQGKTDGRKWMLQSLIFLFRWIDIRIFYAIMAVVVVFYMLINRKNYLAIKDFFRRRFGYGPFRTLRAVYASHLRFGQVVLDRFAFYAGRKFRIEIEHNEYYRELVSAPNGFIMLSSHIGNYELAGYSLHAEEKRVYTFVFSGEKEIVMKNRARFFGANNIEMVAVKRDLSHLFIANNALMEGNIVSMPGDRIFGSQKSVECNFLGAPAKFPLGPFALAVQRNVPILSIFVMKEGTRRYRILIDRIGPQDSEASKQMRMEQCAQEFAAQLERTVRRYPTQWFNYYDFWE